MEISIRQIDPGDSVSVNQLSAQLGYHLTEEQTLQNIKLVLAKDDSNAFVAICDNKVVGWVGVSQTVMIEVIPYCEINGLVVDENFHGQGIGKILIETAKEWARQKGNTKLKLRCNVIRADAHLFYRHLGFLDTKKQTNFEMEI